MKKTICVLTLAVCLQSCHVTRKVPITGNYLPEAFTVVIEQPKQKVWDNIIDVVAVTGIGFSTLDKENGLLISKEYSFKGAVTHEKVNGDLADTSAYIVVPTLYYTVTKQYVSPGLVTGVLTVRVKEVEKGSLLSIALTNIKAYSPTGVPRRLSNTEAKSTGVFEKALANKLK
jgi:hypothetical protein